MDLLPILTQHLPRFFATAAELSGQPPYPDIERVAELVRQGRDRGVIFPRGALVPLHPGDEGALDLEAAWTAVGVSPKSPDTLRWDATLLDEIAKRHVMLREHGGPLWARSCPEVAWASRWLRDFDGTPNAARDSIRRLSRGFGGYGPWIAPLAAIVPVVDPSLFLAAGRESSPYDTQQR